MQRFLKDRSYKLLTDAEAAIICGKRLNVQDFIDKCKEEVKLKNDAELFDAPSRLLVMEMLTFVMDTGITLTLVVGDFFFAEKNCL